MPSTFHLKSRDFAAKHAVTVSGQGESVVVLGNGFGTGQSCWAPLLPLLEPRHKVVRFDWAVGPEHFDSLRYAKFDGYVEDLLTIVKTQAKGACTLIGHSMSAMIGMLAAKREPDLFRHIVMISPAPRYIRDEGYDAGFTREEIDALLMAIGDDYLAWTAAFAPVAVGDPGKTGAIADFRAGLRAMRPDIALTMAELLFTMDLRAELSDYRTPTTIIQPDADPVVPVTIGAYLAARWPQAELVVIESAGHAPHVTAPDKVGAILARVLAR
jgi:sigma-B regulation protein RsbQ